MNKPGHVTHTPLGDYAARKAIHPKAVDGFYRRMKWVIMLVTLAVYYGTPWLRWDRGPYAPDQAVLIDLANRRFYMFAIEIWPHEFYYVAGLLIMAGIGLFLLTSAVGRAWCGYSCPQTVWTDLFQHVDRHIDGDRNAQMRLANAPWSAGKIARRGFKYAVYLVIAFWTGGAWIMYFADAPTLVVDFWSGNAAPVAYATVAVLTATTFILGGFMREQVCIYMCPWPRIQTAMMDEKSLVVTYKDWRGEPRGSVKKAQANPGGIGDCVDCNQCIAVCPTGIDIREGPQIGCITCALCIDACDSVMAQIDRPRGLIDYCTLDDEAAERAGAAPRPHLKTILRPRTIAYALIWCSIGLGMLFTLGQRTRLDLSINHERNPQYVQLSDGSIRNSYVVRVRNMETRPRQVELRMAGLPGAVMWDDRHDRASAGQSVRLTVAPDSVQRLTLQVLGPQTGPQTSSFSISARALTGDERGDSDDVNFDRPEGAE